MRKQRPTVSSIRYTALANQHSQHCTRNHSTCCKKEREPQAQLQSKKIRKRDPQSPAFAIPHSHTSTRNTSFATLHSQPSHLLQQRARASSSTPIKENAQVETHSLQHSLHLTRNPATLTSQPSHLPQQRARALSSTPIKDNAQAETRSLRHSLSRTRKPALATPHSQHCPRNHRTRRSALAIIISTNPSRHFHANQRKCASPKLNANQKQCASRDPQPPAFAKPHWLTSTRNTSFAPLPNDRRLPPELSPLHSST